MKDSPEDPMSVKDSPLAMVHKGLGRGIKPGCFSTLVALYM